MTESNPVQYTIRLFGSPLFTFGDQNLAIRMAKSRAILAYLSATGQEAPRTTLAGLLWSDMAEAAARTNLRAAITTLRKEVGDLLIATRQTLRLNPTLPIQVDAQEIERLWRLWQSTPDEETRVRIRPALRALLGTAQGEFLAGLNLPDAPLFEEWMLLERERLNQLLVDALMAMTMYAVEHNLLDEGVEDAAQILRLDPWRESAHRHLIYLYARQGQRASALNQFEKCRKLLQTEFNVQPEASTLALVEQIRQGAFHSSSTTEMVAGTPTTTPKSSTPDAQSSMIEPNLSSPGLLPPELLPIAPPGNLPVQTGLFFGHEAVVSEIRRLLIEESSCQLLTLVGPGGIGKTRLALEVAPTLKDAFLHGIYFISFAAASHLDQLIPTIAEALQFSFYGDVDPQIQLIQYLNGKRLLMVLDNLEHLVEGAEVLAAILHSLPVLRMLVTSQERLNLHEEWVLSVDGLTFPSSSDLAHWPTEEIRELLESESQPPFLGYSALALFVQRAKVLRGDFNLTEEELPAVVRICEMVDGTPLGIELAAAWVKMLSCHEIADEIGQNLDFLTTSLRNLPQRHRSLRAVFNHAWNLLTSEERTIFRRLAVFSGHFDRHAANGIADASTLDLVALVDKSLVHSRASGQFMLHGQLKQYATEHLAQNRSELAELRQRHAIYFATYLQERNHQLKGSVQKEAQEKALAEVVAVIDEARTAWHWAVQNKQVEELHGLLDTLFRVYEMRSWFQEGVERFGNAIEQISSDRTLTQQDKQQDKVKWQHLLGQLLARQGWFQYQLGQVTQGRKYLEEALSYLRVVANERELIFVLNYLGAIYRDAGEYDLAEERLQESLALCQRNQELFGHTVALNILGNVSYLQGNYQKAKCLCQESLEIKRAIGDRWGVRFSLAYLGVIAGLLGEQHEAEQLFRESLAIAESVDDRRGMASALSNLGYAYVEQGAYEEAKRFHQRSLQLYTQIGNELGVITAHAQLGELAAKEGEFRRSWTHLETALQKASAIGSLPAMIDVLLGVATLRSESNEPQAALAITQVINAHITTSRGTRDKVRALLEKVRRTAVSPSMKSEYPTAGQTVTDATVIALVKTLLTEQTDVTN